MLPLVLLIMITWSVFWMSGERVADRIKILSFAFLTLVTFSLTISAVLPQIPYLTFLDKVLVGTYFYLFLAVVQTMAQYRLRKFDRINAAIKLDRTSRWAYPLTYILLWIILLCDTF